MVQIHPIVLEALAKTRQEDYLREAEQHRWAAQAERAHEPAVEIAPRAIETSRRVPIPAQMGRVAASSCPPAVTARRPRSGIAVFPRKEVTFMRQMLGALILGTVLATTAIAAQANDLGLPPLDPMGGVAAIAPVDEPVVPQAPQPTWVAQREENMDPGSGSDR